MTTRRALTLLVCAVVGLLVAALGTTAHRALPPWGLVVALVAALSGGVLCRALGDGLGLAVHGAALLLLTQLMSQVRPGGDVLVASDALGLTWLFGSVLTCAVVAFLPARWFAREPQR